MKTNRHSRPTLALPKLAPLFAAMLAFLVLAHARTQGGVEALAGRYVGSWTNITFGSTGKAVIDISLNGSVATTSFDMDGFVFGAFDPPLINMPGAVSGSTILIDSRGAGLFGDIQGSILADTGAFNAVLSNIPGGFISKVTATGNIIDHRIALDYLVDFPGPTGPANPARGVMVGVAPSPLTLATPIRKGPQLELQWSGGNAPYQVQVRDALDSGSWRNQGAPVTGTSAIIQAPTTGALFVRIIGT